MYVLNANAFISTGIMLYSVHKVPCTDQENVKQTERKGALFVSRCLSLRKAPA